MEHEYVFFHNYFEWTIMFYVGCHWTYWDFVPYVNSFVLSYSSMKNWPVYCWVMLGVFLVGLVFLIGFVFTLYFISNVFVLGIYIVCTILAFTIITLMSITFDSHFHHYFIGLIIMSFCGHHNFLISMIHGFANGMYIEGNCRYAMDPVWEITKDNIRDETVKEWIFGSGEGV